MSQPPARMWFPRQLAVTPTWRPMAILPPECDDGLTAGYLGRDLLYDSAGRDL